MDEVRAPGPAEGVHGPDDRAVLPPAEAQAADPAPDPALDLDADPSAHPDPDPDPSDVLDAVLDTRDGRDHVVALVERVASLKARVAALQAEQLSVLSDLAVDRFVDEHDVDLVVELGARCRWTSYTADRRLGTAMRLVACFPLLLADLAAGELDLHRVQVVVAEAELLDEEQALVLDAVVAGSLTGLTTAQVKALVRAQIAVIDSDAVRERARRVLARRRVEFATLEDGAASLLLVGPAEAVRGVYDRLDVLARDTTRPGAGTDPYAGLSTPEGADAADGSTAQNGVRGGADATGRGEHDRRGIDAKRFDACVELLRAPVAGAPRVATGTGPHIHLALSSAVGVDDLPAHLSGYGPLPAERVRGLLTHTGFRRVITDPLTGHVVTVDGHTYPAGTLPDVSDPDGRGARPDGQARVGRTTDDCVVDGSAAEGVGARTPATAPTGIESAHTLGRPHPLEGAHPLGSVHPLGTVHTLGRPLATPQSSETPPPPLLAAADPGPGAAAAGSASVPAAGGDAPPWMPEEVEVRDPGPGWNADENGYDPGFDHATDDPADADPAEGPRDSEFTVTLDIAGSRPATLVGPQLVSDPDAWAEAARARAGAALRACPVVVAGDRTYRFSAALRRHLVLRSPHCTAPGCRAPAHRCDLDHTTDHARGGPTCPCNTAPLCRRHHRAKHGRGWIPVRTTDDPGDPTTTWLSPLGYLYTVPALPLLPTTSATAATVGAHLRRRRRAVAALEAVIAARPSTDGILAAHAASKAQEAVDRATRSGPAGSGSEAARSGSEAAGSATTGSGYRVHTTDHVWEDGCRECEPDPVASLRGRAARSSPGAASPSPAPPGSTSPGAASPSPAPPGSTSPSPAPPCSTSRGPAPDGPATVDAAGPLSGGPGTAGAPPIRSTDLGEPPF